MRKTALQALAAFAAVSALTAQEALAQVQTGPQGSGPILGAVRWVQDSVMGPIATAAAVIAVAVVGFMMLTGRMNWKHGIMVIVGCFVLFGAAAIVGGIQQAAQMAR